MNFLHRVRAVAVYSEAHQHYAAEDLQEEAVVVVTHQVHDEAHAKPRYQCVDKVADRRSYACDKAIPSAFVERSLDTEHTDGSHRSRSDDTYENAFKYPVEYV